MAILTISTNNGMVVKTFGNVEEWDLTRRITRASFVGELTIHIKTAAEWETEAGIAKLKLDVENQIQGILS